MASGKAADQPSTNWAMVLLLVGAGVVASFQIGKAPPVLPLLRSSLDLSLVLAGWVLSAFSLLGLALGPGTGALADGLGHRRMLLAGLVIQAAASLIGAAAQGPALLLFTRFVEGLGFMLVAVSAPVLIAAITSQDDLRLAFGVWGTFLPLGTALMMLAAPPLVAAWGWRGLWVGNGLLPALYAAILLPATTGQATTRGGFNLRRLMADLSATLSAPGPLLLGLNFATYSLLFTCLMGFLPTLLVEWQGMSTGQASLLTAAVVGANVVGNLAGGWLLSRGARRWLLICLTAVLMGLCSLGIFRQDLPFGLRYGLCLLFTASGGMWPAAALLGAMVNAPRPDLVGTSQGLLMQGAQLGQMVGPPLLAWLVTAAGWSVTPWLLVPSAFLGLALALVLGLLEHRRGIA